MPAPDALEQSVAQVEGRLLALGEALGEHRAEAVETEAAELQRALATALEQLRRSARDGHLTLPLRQRLALASGRVAKAPAAQLCLWRRAVLKARRQPHAR